MISIKELNKQKAFAEKGLAKIRTEIEFPCYLNMALCELKMMQYEKAIFYADKALLIQPNNTKGLYRKALALIELKREGEAKELLELILKEDKENNEAKMQLRKIKAHFKDLDKLSVGFFQKCMEGLDYSDKPEPKAKEETLKKQGWLERIKRSSSVSFGNFMKRLKQCAKCKKDKRKTK